MTRSVARPRQSPVLRRSVHGSRAAGSSLCNERYTTGQDQLVAIVSVPGHIRHSADVLVSLPAGALSPRKHGRPDFGPPEALPSKPITRRS